MDLSHPYRVSLPWYDLPAVQGPIEQMWRSVRDRLLALEDPRVAASRLPDSLPHAYTDPTGEFKEDWDSPRLLLTQACGVDVLHQPQLIPIARPAFDLSWLPFDVAPGEYVSVLVQRQGGSTDVAAINGKHSRSGCNALLESVRPRRIVLTGSHSASLEALRLGQCDIAAIDAVSFALFRRHLPHLCKAVEVQGYSSPAPAPPWVCHVHAGSLCDQLARALHDALRSSVGRRAGLALLIQDAIPANRNDYEALNHETGRTADILAEMTARGAVVELSR